MDSSYPARVRNLSTDFRQATAQQAVDVDSLNGDHSWPAVEAPLDVPPGEPLPYPRVEAGAHRER